MQHRYIASSGFGAAARQLGSALRIGDVCHEKKRLMMAKAKDL
jgi:hypothetical protein